MKDSDPSRDLASLSGLAARLGFCVLGAAGELAASKRELCRRLTANQRYLDKALLELAAIGFEVRRASTNNRGGNRDTVWILTAPATLTIYQRGMGHADESSAATLTNRQRGGNNPYVPARAAPCVVSFGDVSLGAGTRVTRARANNGAPPSLSGLSSAELQDLAQTLYADWPLVGAKLGVKQLPWTTDLDANARWPDLAGTLPVLVPFVDALFSAAAVAKLRGMYPDDWPAQLGALAAILGDIETALHLDAYITGRSRSSKDLGP